MIRALQLPFKNDIYEAIRLDNIEMFCMTTQKFMKNEKNYQFNPLQASDNYNDIIIQRYEKPKYLKDLMIAIQ